jgi:hypothetical protein
VGEPAYAAGKALVSVNVVNFGKPDEFGILLVKEADGWKVDDVASLGSDQNWLLSWLLQYDPFGAM